MYIRKHLIKHSHQSNGSSSGSVFHLDWCNQNFLHPVYNRNVLSVHGMELPTTFFSHTLCHRWTVLNCHRVRPRKTTAGSRSEHSAFVNKHIWSRGAIYMFMLGYDDRMGSPPQQALMVHRDRDRNPSWSGVVIMWPRGQQGCVECRWFRIRRDCGGSDESLWLPPPKDKLVAFALSWLCLVRSRFQHRSFSHLF